MVFVPTGSPANASNFGNPIDRSLRFNDGDSPYLSFVFGTPTNQIKWTMSMWVKRSEIGREHSLYGASNGGGGTTIFVAFYPDDIETYISTGRNHVTDAVFRDPSAWYHIVQVFDSANATADDRFITYVNGVRQTTSTNSITLNDTTGWNTSGVTGYLGQNYGGWFGDSRDYFDGYLAEVHFCDGTAYDADDFGEFNATTGEWVPKEVTGLTYGTNGFYLPFSDNTNTTTLGEDSSGNGNDWTLNNLATTDSVTDTPTNNFATLSPIDIDSGTLSEANLAYAGGGDAIVRSSVVLPSGKWYAEITIDSVGANRDPAIGICNAAAALTTGNPITASIGYWCLAPTGNKSYSSNVSYGSGFSSTNIMMLAVDIENGKIWWGKDGTWFATGDPAAGTNEAFSGISTSIDWMFAQCANEVSAFQATWNFGQLTTTGDNADENGYGSFEYAPPAGFLALCSANLPEPTIIRPRDHFDTVLYTGDGTAIGSGGQSVTGDETWTPGFAWIKNRDAADSHMLFDEVRGATNYLESDTTDDEATDAESLTSFDAGGFTVGSNVAVNTNTEDFVAWLWKGAGSASNNTTGDITSSVSVNTTAGISIGTYTGTGTSGHTIGHGLGDAPGLILVKARTTASTNTDWAVYHHENTSAPETDYLNLNDTGATADDAGFWNDAAPTSTVFSVGNNAAVNTASDTYGFLAFAEVPGFSKFGSYTGNGSSDGPFVWCGFKPRWVVLKGSTRAEGWYIFDVERSTFNPVDDKLRADFSNAEAVSEIIDITSNGFKIRTSGSGINHAATYIFAAFADIPFKYARAR